MSDETLSRAGLPRRIEFLTRQHGLLEASVPMAEGQALAPYLNSRSAGVELADVRIVATGETHEKLVLRQADVIHARPLEAHVPVVRPQPEGGEDVAVEVTLGSGDVIRGSFIMAPGQSIGEHLGSSGTFAVLTTARADGRITPPSDLAVNQYAMQRIRDAGEVPTRRDWQRGGTAAPAARAHWLLRAAREQGLAGCEDLQLPPGAPILDVWRAICEAATVTEPELAAAVGRRLRIRVATAEELSATPPDIDLSTPLLQRFGVRMLHDDGRTLTVATSDPMDADAEQTLGFATKRRISFVLAGPGMLMAAHAAGTRVADETRPPAEAAEAAQPADDDGAAVAATHAAAASDAAAQATAAAAAETARQAAVARAADDAREAAAAEAARKAEEREEAERAAVRAKAERDAEAAAAEATAREAAAAEAAREAAAAEATRQAEAREEVERQTQRRSETIRALMLGLDRCVADGGGMADVLGFAGEQLASAFDSPLVWIATMAEGAPEIRACAGTCAPYVRSVKPRWDAERDADGAVASAIRTGAPQGTRIDDEPAFEAWREHMRAHGAPLLLVVPMLVEGEAIGVIGMHTRNMHWLDRDSGAELLAASERIGNVVQRLRRLEAIDVQLSAFHYAADAVFLTDREGVIQWVNRAFVELSGYQPEEAIGRRPNIMRSDRHDADFFRDVWETILAGNPWRGELYNLRSDGSTYAVEQTITPVLNRDHAVTHFLSVQRDITERKQRESRVRQLLTRDPMTGLPNARAFERELQNAVATVAKGAPPAALLLVHAEGVAANANVAAHDDAEALARLLATTLRSTLRPEDTLARLGDFEFAALLPGTTDEGAVVAAERLRAAAAARFAEDAEGRGIVRVGLAQIDGAHGARAVLAVADAALYGQRDKAGDIAARSQPGAASEIGAEWADRIRAAVRDGLFFLHYQPVVRLSTGSVAHYDALLRLHDERGKVVPARAFITHAEGLGLMPEIDRWVVEHVMRLLQVSPDLCVSLNVSGATVASAGFREFVQRQSRRMAAVGARMIFEVGETTTVEELPRLVDGMNHMRELGCRFTLDNFGLSAGSVASLGALPLDYAKLDRSLVTGIDVDENRYEITRALTAVARALGREVIAGCAERAGIVDVLPELGIDMAQGHYFGAPAAELRGQVGRNGSTADARLLATAGNGAPASN